MNYIEIVSELNAEHYDEHRETELCFSYSTNGYYDAILFDNAMLWNSELDDREFDEATNEYEPFLPYIKKVFNKYFERLESLKFK